VPRALWKGSISFGLVNIPIELHTAVRDSRPHFRILHAKDKSPVRFERVCIRDGRPVAWEDLVKGYEYEKGQFVVLTKDDFKAAAIEKTGTVDIIDFVKADEIDDRFFETPYYLIPAKSGERAYALLREAIRESGRIGIAKFILRAPGRRVYVDYLQNILGKTLATAYSARASAYAGVSTPLTWAEVDHGVRREDFTIRTAPARFKQVGDLWAALRRSKGIDLSRVARYAERTSVGRLKGERSK